MTPEAIQKLITRLTMIQNETPWAVREKLQVFITELEVALEKKEV